MNANANQNPVVNSVVSQSMTMTKEVSQPEIPSTMNGVHARMCNAFNRLAELSDGISDEADRLGASHFPESDTEESVVKTDTNPDGIRRQMLITMDSIEHQVSRLSYGLERLRNL